MQCRQEGFDEGREMQRIYCTQLDAQAQLRAFPIGKTDWLMEGRFVIRQTRTPPTKRIIPDREQSGFQFRIFPDWEYGKMIAAVNTGNTHPLLKALHPELQKLVDEPVLSCVLSYVGFLPAAEDVDISEANGGDGQEIAAARIPCEQGEVTLHLTALEDKLVAFNFDTKRGGTSK